jgi:hypothetical protein
VKRETGGGAEAAEGKVRRGGREIARKNGKGRDRTGEGRMRVKEVQRWWREE